MVRPAACLFDLDGLLLDTEPLHAEAWQQAASQFGRRLSVDELLALRGRRRQDCADQVLEWIATSGARTPSREELLAVRQPIAEALLIRAAPMPGAPELVEQCTVLGIPMAMATSSSKAAVELKASPHPWLQQINVRVHGDDPALRRGKPAPDVFLLAAERLGVEASGCWAFEDSPAGVRAAVAAGCLVHVLPPDHLSAEQRQALYPGISHFLGNLMEVLKALQ
jgi:pseudouridine-5'-monophosphatase